MENTLYWHDYETFGIDPRKDRAAQFAGVRTDHELNVTGDPLVIYCKPPADYLPQPEACLITGITPQIAYEKGECEAKFIFLIHQQISQPQTCTVGYNSIRFDDEVTRNLLYRNFYDPYAREWKGGNSRWDLIDLARAARALRPDGIKWPDHEDGRPSFRLEEITAANGIEHGMAHDALSDVMATIEVAKLIKKAQPKLYQFLFSHRTKNQALKLLQLGSHQPVLHISGKYPSAKNCLAVVLPICQHPTNNNGVVVYDLSVDPAPLLTLSSEEIHQRIFTAQDDLPDDVQRIPLKTVHINKCPVLAPMNVLRDEDIERLGVDLDCCNEHLQQFIQAQDLDNKLSVVFNREFAGENDPDLMIYSGGFFDDSDRREMIRIRNTPPTELATLKTEFNDPRLPEMFFRFRARNYPETLSKDESKLWQAFCLDRLTNPAEGSLVVLDSYFELLNKLKENNDVDQNIVTQLVNYGKEIVDNVSRKS